jgi:VanZ family protein
MKIIANWAPVILWMAFIFWMSSDIFSSQNTAVIIEPVVRYLAPSVSTQEADIVHGVIRKLMHVIEYFILGILLFRAFRGGKAGQGIWRCAFYSLLVVALFAASDEFHQSYVSTRTPALFDVGIDIVGGFLAQCIRVLWDYRRQ